MGQSQYNHHMCRTSGLACSGLRLLTQLTRCQASDWSDCCQTWLTVAPGPQLAYRGPRHPSWLFLISTRYTLVWGSSCLRCLPLRATERDKVSRGCNMFTPFQVHHTMSTA